ncbi:MAG: hypothetical protein HY901_32415, partial [Deltaproteobacteria bacterium]|nr:hypothetical protein [Deltaproteobacteria bacterium]
DCPDAPVSITHGVDRVYVALGSCGFLAMSAQLPDQQGVREVRLLASPTFPVCGHAAEGGLGPPLTVQRVEEVLAHGDEKERRLMITGLPHEGVRIVHIPGPNDLPVSCAEPARSQ